MKLLALAALLLRGAPATAAPPDRWSRLVAEASARFSLPADWIRRVLMLESGGRTMLGGRPIVSRAGAMGPMQLMPATWREMRALLRLGEDPFEPRDNLLAGAAYLKRMYERFGYPGLFAAYDAGPGRYAAFVAGRRPLPAETRAYLDALVPPPRPLSGDPHPLGDLFALGPPGVPKRRAEVPVRQARLFVLLSEPAQ